jgi:5'-nucleotidase
MRRSLLVCVCCAVLAALVPAGASAAPSKTADTHVQLLAINDLHGHLAPNTPGTIQVGCCNPVITNGVQTGWTQRTVPAGGIAYLATHMKALRATNSNTLSVPAT